MKPKKLDIYEPMRRVDPHADEIVQKQIRQFRERPAIVCENPDIEFKEVT